MKKIKLFLANVLVMALFITPFLVFGRIDYLTARSDTKATVMSLSKAGKTAEEIADFYKFDEYPHHQILADLKRSGEFDKLVLKGREK